MIDWIFIYLIIYAVFAVLIHTARVVKHGLTGVVVLGVFIELAFMYVLYVLTTALASFGLVTLLMLVLFWVVLMGYVAGKEK